MNRAADARTASRSGAARHLVTTADERTWKTDRPILFLGEWCRRYDRRETWSRLDAAVAPAYGRGREARDRDHAAARELERALWPVVVEELNRVHATTHGDRFWRMLLGHWLARYADVVFNRFHALRMCVETHDLRGASVLGSPTYHLATRASEAFIWACDDDTWNSFLDARVLRHLSDMTPPVEFVSVSDGPGFRVPRSAKRAPARRPIRGGLIEAAEVVTRALVRERDAFIINSYLPRAEEMRAQFLLGQVPRLWRSPRLDLSSNVDTGLRAALARRVSATSASGFERCALELVFDLLPMCFLEDFDAYRECAEALPWPKRPRFVYTSNSGDTDEVFKQWAAANAEAGTPYHAGQHGNNAGTHRYMNPTVEECVAEKYLTWGWTDGLPSHTPAFIVTTAGRTPPTPRPDGGLLLVEVCLGHRITPWDGDADFVAYFEDQLAFVNRLGVASRDALTVRFHSSHRRLKWAEEARWTDFDHRLRLDGGDRPIRDAIAESRLVVHSYDSTGILEGLTQNVPTLAFWQDGFNHLRESARPWYQILVDAGIVHVTAESAAMKVNEVWDCVSGWWHGATVQTARRQFCQRYAVVRTRPAREFARILTNESTPRNRPTDARADVIR
jgi:putative transferase (TIGR04331 family)